MKINLIDFSSLPVFLYKNKDQVSASKTLNPPNTKHPAWHVIKLTVHSQIALHPPIGYHTF